MSITARDLKDRLANRHSDDVFIRECKDGMTWNNPHSRLDAWAMRKSWTQPCYWGYEIKVSRSDFLGDTKWVEYLPLCNELYFVTPPGLIKEAELPEGVGLIVATKTGGRLLTKRKAQHRQIDPPVDLLHYALMQATGFSNNGDLYSREGTSAYWRQVLEEKNADRVLGQAVSRKIRKLVNEQIVATKRENDRLRRENGVLADVKKMLDAAGLGLDSQTANRIKQGLAVDINRYDARTLRDAHQALGRVCEMLEDQ
jgi:hypothetical protein